MAFNLQEAAKSLAINCFVFANVFLCAKLSFNPSVPAKRLASFLYLACLSAVLVYAFLEYDKVIFYTMLRAWPFLLTLGLIFCLYRYVRSKNPDKRFLSWVICCIIFCNLLFLKTYFAVVFTYYGGFLTFPSLIFFFIASILFISRQACSQTAQTISVAFFIAFFCIVSIYSTKQTLHAYASKSQTLHGVNGEIHVANPSILQPILEEVAALAVFPEGVMVNYLSNLASSTKYYVTIPLEWNLYGRKDVVGSVSANPPKWILLIMRGAREYGHTYLCDSYGHELCGWIDNNYAVSRTFGEIPFRSGAFGALLLRRKDATASKWHRPDVAHTRTAGPF